MKLKPCPFCGGEAILKDSWKGCFDPDDKYRYSVGCDYVKCQVNPTTNYYETPQQAIQAWNKRSKDD